MTLKDKVYIKINATANITSFADIDPTHASIGCTGCHGGLSPVDASDDTSAYRAAHAGVSRDPSAIGEEGCSGGLCHGDIVRRNETSLHSNLWGEKAHVARRNGYATFESCPAEIQDGFSKDCSSCHTTCGQCHISRPNAAGGGFMENRLGYSHKFIRTPSEENVCTACHGSRVGDDWNANQERVPGNVPDAHNQNGFSCLDCHEEDFHGNGPSDAEYTSRYAVQDIPQCTNCHQGDHDDNAFHAEHWPNADASDGADLACFVCHSQQYNNCNTCHAGTWKSEYEADNSGEYRVYPQFKLGKNPYYGVADHPHTDAKWITVRHVPVSPDAFKNWNVDPWDIETMPDTRNMETWKYSSPHNIQRWTSRTLVDSTWQDSAGYTTGTCNDNCHMHGSFGPGTMQNVGIYLTDNDMLHDITNDNLSNEIEANALTSLGTQSGSCAVCH
ncbi:MAG: cytochrome c3 family protein [Candidatus Marinimicrobia bacterium]|nr:cytochrome c3 family protein [Candidatus Neomarinimicrobiota bacterium]